MKDTPAKPLPRYWAPYGGLPGQHELLSGRAVFTEAYAFIPRGVMTDIVTSALPFWDKTRAWIIARPMTGFSETFSQYIMEVQPGGGSERPELDPGAEGVLFLLQGEMQVTIAGETHAMEPGGYAFLPPGIRWSLSNAGTEPARFQWIRKSYEPVEGLGLPDPVVGNERNVKNMPMPDTDGRWTTTRFFDHDDMRMDMHVTIVNLMPGAEIPFTETHVMEHGLYMLEGQGMYLLQHDWHECWEGDFIYMAPYCPQFFYATGWSRASYLLYKNGNRDNF